MGCRITELVLDCREPEQLARFWCEVLGFVVLGREGDDIEIGPPEGFRAERKVVSADHEAFPGLGCRPRRV